MMNMSRIDEPEIQMDNLNIEPTAERTSQTKQPFILSSPNEAFRTNNEEVCENVNAQQQYRSGNQEKDEGTVFLNNATMSAEEDGTATDSIYGGADGESNQNEFDDDHVPPLPHPASSSSSISNFSNSPSISICRSGSTSGSRVIPEDELNVFLSDLMGKMTQKFDVMGQSILSRIDNMGGRIDHLEQSVGDLLTSQGLANNENARRTTTAPGTMMGNHYQHPPYQQQYQQQYQHQHQYQQQHQHFDSNRNHNSHTALPPPHQFGSPTTSSGRVHEHHDYRHQH
uniref:Heat shock factor-binding protein 1 n=1 Tax=Chaetoceros debilis TaxID=122233 RepID=A0A7S3Q2C7_9STRA|mmetsp:Transcript_4823/g.7058  ORF Transcript_4823/g.7058 Transcript_4823/m.7058 type:complete len:284 (+) Transcript_4823:356-1207(+)